MKICPAFNVPHASTTSTDVIVGSEVLFTCNEGYEKTQGAADSDLKATCTIHSEWKENGPKCERKLISL